MIVLKNRKSSCQFGRCLIIRGGYITIVDDDLHDFLSQFKWFPKKSSSTVYVCTRKIYKGKAYTIRMHRLITQAPSFMKVHHIDHDSLNNMRSNLKLVTEREHRHFDGWHIFYR